MLRCNLAVLLSERNLKITKISKDTGLSRTTLTALANNHGQGIQFDTINTLCTYLDVSPGQLFLFAPYDISIGVSFISCDFECFVEKITPNKFEEFLFDVEFNVTSKRMNAKMHMCASLSINKNSFGFIDDVDICLNFFDADEDDVEQALENKNLTKCLRELHISFLKEIEEKICKDFIEECKEINKKIVGSDDVKIFYLKNGEYVEDISRISYRISWPHEIIHEK